mmetsp:Transcript_18089/g.37580  ORF Transcript_18089/g.37580 Transcript_18089/m.37580 type:complete len:211 (-) Transcript_18089:2191-2823(-)
MDGSSTPFSTPLLSSSVAFQVRTALPPILIPRGDPLHTTSLSPPRERSPTLGKKPHTHPTPSIPPTLPFMSTLREHTPSPALPIPKINRYLVLSSLIQILPTRPAVPRGNRNCTFRFHFIPGYATLSFLGMLHFLSWECYTSLIGYATLFFMAVLPFLDWLCYTFFLGYVTLPFSAILHFLSWLCYASILILVTLAVFNSLPLDGVFASA